VTMQCTNVLWIPDSWFWS